MNIVTIVDSNWVNNHLGRFATLASRAMPKQYYVRQHDITIDLNKYFVVVVCEPGTKDDMAGNQVLAFFDEVHIVDREDGHPGYLQYNSIRFSLLERFGIDECLYTDADVDIFADISAIPKVSQAPLLWARSPCAIDGMDGLLSLLGLPVGDDMPHHNAGTLYMRRDFKSEYEAAAARVVKTDYTPRMIGNAAFNVMVRSLPEDAHAEMPYKFGTIWWDAENLGKANLVHFCNDHGKAKRAWLDSVWVT